ncbi:MAG: hypothetical protein IMZ58_07670 [Thermoplasmata archaeon]|nr:hypothetical protein [Thermoplasmata archaeon]
MTTQTKVVCPLCSLNRTDSSFERKDESAYGTWNEDRPIIQIRDAPGGKASSLLVGSGKYRKTPGRGFPMIDSFTLDQAMNMPEYSGYVDQVTEQLLKVLKVFYEKKLISDEDVDSIRGR